MAEGLRHDRSVVLLPEPFENILRNPFGIEVVDGNIHNDFFIFGIALNHISVDVEEVDNSVAGTGFYLRIIA